MHDKIYICITPFFPTPSSFRGPFVYDQVNAIERNSDYQVIVFVPKAYGSKKADYEYEGRKVYYFENINTPSYILHGVFNKINAHFFLNKIKELNIDINNIEIAHGHTAQFATYALALKQLNPKIKAVVQHHDPDPYTIRNGKWAQKSWNAKYRAKKNIELLEKVDLNLCISEFVKDSLISFPDQPKNLYFSSYKDALKAISGIRKPNLKDTYILYNGVDTRKFHVSENHKHNDCFTIGSIGNLVDWKDHITLLKAVNLLIKDGVTDIKLIIIGSGIKYEECNQFINENNLNEYVELRSEVHHSLLIDFYNSIDLYVQPSFFEGFGCVCTEAAACGVPFMICKHQGAAEYISPEEEKLWLFEPRDYMVLAKNILYYKVHKPKQTYIHSFDIDILIKRYLRIYKEEE